jgi:hypothetical protein
MTFNLKSGNGPLPFKQMGSSPAKQKYKAKGKSFRENIDVGTSKSNPNISQKEVELKKQYSNKPIKRGTSRTATGGDKALEKLKAKRIANTKAGKIIKFGEGSNIIADKGLDSQGRNTWGDKVGKAKKVVKKGVKVAKKVIGKAAKFAGGKALGVAGMMMATSSKADQPKEGKGKVKYPGGKIDFTSEK